MDSDTVRETAGSAADARCDAPSVSFETPEISRLLVEQVLAGQDYVVLVSESWRVLDANEAFVNSILQEYPPEAASFLDTLTTAARSQLEGLASRGQLEARGVDLFHRVPGGARWVNYRCRAWAGGWLLLGRDQSAQLELAEQLSSLGDELLRSLGVAEPWSSEAPGVESETLGRLETEGPEASGGASEATSSQCLEEALAKQQERCAERSVPLSMLLVDVDRFRQVNAVFGHPLGDQVLERVGAVIRENIRDEDELLRVRGHEFAVILPGLGREGALEVAERLRSVVEKTKMPRGVWKVTVSIGTATFSGGGPEGGRKDLASLAQRALRLAKDGGRNCVRYAD